MGGVVAGNAITEEGTLPSGRRGPGVSIDSPTPVSGEEVDEIDGIDGTHEI